MTTKYNATVTETSKDKTQTWTGVFVAEVKTINGRPQMLSSNARQTYRYEGLTFTSDNSEGKWKAGDAVYDYYFRQVHPNSDFEIVLDKCDGYINRLSATSCPPTYARAMKAAQA